MNYLDYNKSVDLERLQNIPRDDNSVIFVRERQRKEKLNGLFKKKRKVTAETGNMVEFAPEGRTDEIVLSKREIACIQKTRRTKELTNERNRVHSRKSEKERLKRLHRCLLNRNKKRLSKRRKTEKMGQQE